MRIKRQLDDPRTLGEPVKGAVIFAFGILGSARPTMPGPVLVTVMAALGFGEATARATILRMRRDGRLTSVRRGPRVDYALTAPSRALSEAVLKPVIEPRPQWDGVFHALLFSIPEPERTYRDGLRRAAVAAGFGLLQSGVFVTPDERRWTPLGSIVDAAPAGSRLMRAELRLSLADAATAAGAAWPLAALARRYRAHIEDLERVAAESRAHPLTGALAVRGLWEAMAPLFATAAEDPGLPAALLPANWPGQTLPRAVAAVSMELGPAVQAYLRELVQAADA